MPPGEALATDAAGNEAPQLDGQALLGLEGEAEATCAAGSHHSDLPVRGQNR